MLRSQRDYLKNCSIKIDGFLCIAGYLDGRREALRAVKSSACH
jgi:hypothetical protein